MRLKIIFFPLLFALGCSSISLSNNIAPGYVEAFKTLNTVLLGHDKKTFSKELIYQIPYASMIVKIGKGPEGLMILERKKENQELWVSADEVLLGITEGRITSSEGLINNLTSLTLSKRVVKISDVEEGFVYKNYYSYKNPDLYFLEVEAVYKISGSEPVSLFDREVDLNLIEEKLENKYLGWEVTNRYWLDEEGFIWKSEQHISPKLPVIKIEVTKKPS